MVHGQLIRPPKLVEVQIEGHSMEPVLQHGTRVSFVPDSSVAVGDVVVAKHPFRTGVLVIKRVRAIEGDRFDLRGDNPAASTDSRSLGWFEGFRILGVVEPGLPDVV